MRFYVIYSFDTTSNVSVKEFQPPDLRKWTLTEQDEQYDYGYLADEGLDSSGFLNGKHRKYVRELSKQGFKEFIRHCGLIYEDVDTMGSITDRGWLPAMSFHSEGGMSIYDKYGLITASAYVTPLPEPVRDFHPRVQALISKTYPQTQLWELQEDEIIRWWTKKEEKYWGWLKEAFKTEFSY